jgi:hypothetical protein
MSTKWIIFAFLVVSATAQPNRLTSQKATEIVHNTKHYTTGYNKTADVPHISFDAYNNAVDATKKFVRKMLVDGLREQFSTFKQSFTQFADDEGFVRSGIAYCGAPSFVTNAVPDDYKSETGVLIESDGVGDSEKFNETKTCSSLTDGVMIDHCDENSVVGSLARIVRGLGLNIHHQDICDAVIDSSTSYIRQPDVFAMTLQAYPTTRFERSCESKNNDARSTGRFFERNSKCFGTRNASCSGTCTFFERENTCYAKESNNETKSEFCDAPSTTQKITPPEQSSIPVVNAVRRATAYGLTQLSVEATNYAFVTGCKADSCNSLRSVFAALNGNTQINAFRDLGIEEAGEHWLNEIRTIKGYLTDFAYRLTNFREMSLEIFPYIEDEEIEGCPMGETKFEDHLTGTEEEPLCYQASLNSTKLNTMDQTGQSFSRAHCMCRNGRLGKYTGGLNYNETILDPNRFSKLEQDDLYLATDNSFGCDNHTLPVSAYTFCRQIQAWGDQPSWEQTLRSLEPAATKSRIKIYTYSTSSDLSNKRDKFVSNVAKTLPLALDTSCGRIVNADSESVNDPLKVKRSNRGGNCPPFAKMQDILYMLEFETGERSMGSYEDGDNTKDETTMFKDLYCSEGTFSENSFSFRQLAYKWDGAARIGENTPKYEDPVKYWFYNHSLSNDQESPRYTDRFLINGIASVGGGPAEFCHPHWIYQIGGDVGRVDAYGVIFEDPYILLREEIQEAVFNTKLAQAAKTQVREQNALIWGYIEEQLTTNIPGTVVDHLGAAAGKHYMRIWVDEHQPDPPKTP